MSQINQALKILRQLRDQQKQAQDLLKDKKYSYAAQQNLVTIEMNGKFEILSLSINDGLVDPDDIITLEEMVCDTVVECTKLILKDYEMAVPEQLRQVEAMDPTGIVNKEKNEWNEMSFNYECVDNIINVLIRGSMVIEKITIINKLIVDPTKKKELEEILKNDLSDALNAVYDDWDKNNNDTTTHLQLF